MKKQNQTKPNQTKNKKQTNKQTKQKQKQVSPSYFGHSWKAIYATFQCED